MKEVLDAATATCARRPGTLLLCSALSLGPVVAAAGVFAQQVLAPERPSLFGLLGVGVLSAAAWLAFCWGQAASVRVCRGELIGRPVTLAVAIRRGLEDVPRVMLAAASRGVMLALGATPGSVRAVVLYEAMALGVLSLVLGAAITFPLMVWFHNAPPDMSWAIADVTLMGALLSPSLRVEYDVLFWIQAAVALFATALLASLIPAWRAARVPPADTLSAL